MYEDNFALYEFKQSAAHLDFQINCETVHNNVRLVARHSGHVNTFWLKFEPDVHQKQTEV